MRQVRDAAFPVSIEVFVIINSFDAKIHNF